MYNLFPIKTGFEKGKILDEEALYTFRENEISINYGSSKDPVILKFLDILTKGLNKITIIVKQTKELYNIVSQLSGDYRIKFITRGESLAKREQDNILYDIGSIIPLFEMISLKDNLNEWLIDLYCLIQFHEFCHLSGLNEIETLYCSTLFYLQLPKKTRLNIFQLLEIFQEKGIDRDSLFYVYLKEIQYINMIYQGEETESRIRKKISWFQSHLIFNHSYNLKRIQEILRSDITKDEKTKLLLSDVFNKKFYNDQTEKKNALDFSLKLLNAGKFLTVSRHSRASYYLVLLASGSRLIIELKKLKEMIKPSKDILSKISLIEGNELEEIIVNGVNTLEGSFTKLQMIYSGEITPSSAQIIGRFKEIRENIDNFEKRINEQIIEFGRRVRSPKIELQWDDLRLELFGYLTRIRRITLESEEILNRLKFEYPNFSILVQRASPTGVRALGWLCLGENPFEADEKHIEDALKEGAMNIWATPDNFWFKIAHYWIEALPLYIHKEFDPQRGDHIIIEQEEMEEVFKNYLMHDWKDNIDITMMTEHLGIARHYLSEFLPELWSKGTKISQQEQEIKEETVEFNIIEENIRENPKLGIILSQMAVIVEKTWRNMRYEVAERQNEEDLSRYEALCKEIEINSNESNLIKKIIREIRKNRDLSDILEELIKKEDEILNNTSLVYRLKHKIDYYKNYIHWPRRNLPTWIILTTQAAGMSSVCAANWLEEAMSLKAITEDLQINGETLEQEAAQLADKYDQLIFTVTKKVLRDFGLDYLIEEYEYQNDKFNEWMVLKELLYKYPDVAREVAKLCVINEILIPELRKYDDDPNIINEIIKEYKEEILFLAITRVRNENIETRDYSNEQIMADEDYRLVVENYIKILGRERVINSLEPEKIRNILKWYISAQTEGSLPKFLRHRIKDSLGMITARYEILSRYRIKNNGELIHGADNQDIPYALFLRNDPAYDYTSHGKNKKYNRGYGPSRVDLGLFERRSVEEWAQWIGPVDHFSKITMEKFYELYNQNVYAFDNIREAETMKPFENMMMEASLAISHLSMAIIQAIGIGDFYKYAYQTNIRPEVFIRLGGGGSSGFCQPKDIYFLPFVVGLSFDASLEFAGITADNWSVIEDIYTKLKGRIEEHFSPKLIAQVSHYLDEAIAARKEELKSAGLYSESFMTGGKAFSISGNLAQAIKQIGFGIPIMEPQQFLKHLIGTYSANLFDLLEDRIRFSNITLLWQIWDAIKHVRNFRLDKGSAAPDYEESVIVLPVEYKTVGDPRLSTGLKLKDLMVGLGSHLIKPLGTEGIALADLLLKGFNKNDLEMIHLIAKGLGKDSLDEKDIEVLEHLYPPLGYPKDIRLVSPYGLTRDAVFSYVVGAELDIASEQARTILGRYLKEAQIKANILSYGAVLEKWLGLNPNDIKKIKEEIHGKIFALVWDIRLRDAEYRNKIYTNLWESIRGSDVFCIIVHYMELTGPEDIDKTDDRIKFMLLDLARIRDIMRNGNSNSSLIIVDAPVQGRKPAFDEIAIKMWIALEGTYISPSIGKETIEKCRKEVEEDKRISNKLYKSIISEDDLGARNAFKELKALAYNRYIEADIIEKFAQMGRDRFRGGGFLNYSERHRLFREGWARIVNAQKYEELTFELLVVAGLMYELNGIPEEDIERARVIFENLVKRRGDASKVDIFNEKEKKILRENFIRGRYIEPIQGRIEVKGERSSIKSRDINVQNVEGKAKAMARERKRVKNLHIQKIGFEKAIKDEIRMEKGDYFYQLYHRAKNVLKTGNERISYEDFGKFLGYSYRAFRHEVEKIIIDSQLRQQIFRKIEKLYNNGLGDEQEKWRNNWDELMGKEDVPGEIGRLALELNGDKDRLKELAFLVELLEILLVFILTFEFQLEERYSIKLSNQVFSSIQNFYSMTIYDHVMDYPPRWMTPSEIGPGFTDYDFIMGKWMRGGKPFNREEIISISVSTHLWLKAYLSNLIKTKTWMYQLKKSQLTLIMGNERKIPIGAGEGCYSEIEQQWNSYNQLRELSFLDRDGHRISWAFDDLDANELSQGRPFAAIISPLGRTHLTCYLAENGKYNKEFPEYQTTWILTRSIIFKKREINGQTLDLMLIRDGLSYISVEEFGSLLHKRKVNKEEIENLIMEALKYNQDGILIAVRFKEEAVACFSMPFHGWITYQLGLDEKIGLPTGQEWISNYWMYDKTYETLIHPENCGVLLPEEHKWYMNWQFDDLGQGKRRLEADILYEILNGRERFVGLKNLPWVKAIAKASRQSGGRGSKAMQIRDFEGKIIEENIKELANHIMIIGWVDNQVIQRTLPASPRLWASKSYIDKLRQALIAKGVPAPEDSQYFSYVRIIIVRDQTGAEYYIFPLVVTSRATISNVGRGGVLFELLPEYFINLDQYSIFIKEMERVAFKSLQLTQIASEELIKKLIGDQEVDEAARLMKDRILISSRNKYQDLTGWKYVKPRYMMFDLIPMPILKFKNSIIRRPEILDIKYDNKGNISNFIVLDTENWKIIEASVKNISGWDMILIENNVGYGLWHPFKEDQKLREYDRAEKAKENINTKNWGSDLRKVMYGFSSAAWAYYKKIYSKTPIISSPPISKPLYLKPELIPIIRKELVQETIELRGIESISKKISMILSEVIGKDKIVSWRENWKDVIEQEIIIELTQYTKENYTFILKKLETDLGLHYEELLLLINDEYLERIYAEVCDSIFTERLIPDIIIYPRNKIPENIDNLLKGFKYAFIFDGFLGRADNIYTFIHSAYIASERLDKLQSQLKVPIVVVGVNKNWLDKNGMIHRVLIYDFDKEKLIETDLYKPILPDKVAVRNLNENEIEEHRRISLIYRNKGINQLNLDSLEPLSGAARADDKWSITVNIKESVAVPVTICIEKNMEEIIIKEILKDLLSSTQRRTFYIQIALGTEGKGIERYVYNGNFDEFVRKIYTESRTEKLIVREEVGNIRYQTYRKITFRINTSFLEGVSKAESGFAQIGALGSALSSPSRGGEIISFQKANDELFYLDQKGNTQQITLNENLKSGMFDTAEKALEALNRGLNKELILQFAGIDIELELTPQKMIYYVLDINPRPAGLRHASNLKNIEEILPSLRIFQNLSKE